VRVAVKAAANAIAIATAAAAAVAAVLVTAHDGCVGFGGGSDSGGNNDGSGRRTTTAQHKFISPSPGCKVFGLSRFPLISDRTECTHRRPRCVEQIYRAGTRVGGA
jgi:hypothetical protein